MATTIKATDLTPGMVVKIYQKIKELTAKGEEKERLQVFEGTIINRRHSNEPGATVTVRKISDGVGVEKIFPIHSPVIDHVELVKQYAVRRANLSYMRAGFKRKLKEQAAF